MSCAGTCLNVRTSTKHCGNCTTDCTTLAHVTASGVSCKAGTCNLTGACAAGYADCDGSAADGCEVTLATSGANCGTCGHSCGTEKCQSGHCVAEVVDTGTSAGAPISLALDASYVYWTDGGSIYRKLKDGTGGRTTIASHSLPSGNSGDAIGSIDVDNTYVYFAANGTQPASGGSAPLVMRVPKDGSASPTTIATMPGGVAQQQGASVNVISAQLPNYLYFTASQYHEGGVYSLLKSNPVLESPLPNTSRIGPDYQAYVGNLVLDASHIFVTHYEEIASASLAQGIVQCDTPSCSNLATIASWAEAGGGSNTSPDPSLGVDSGYVYWAQAPNGTAIARSPIGKHSVEFLADVAPHQPGTLAVDDADGWVYWLVQGASGGLQKAAKNKQGQTPLWLVTSQASPVALRMDATHLYWGEYGTHKIWRVAR